MPVLKKPWYLLLSVVVAFDVPFFLFVTPVTGPFSSVTAPRTGKSAATAAECKNSTRLQMKNNLVAKQ